MKCEHCGEMCQFENDLPVYEICPVCRFGCHPACAKKHPGRWPAGTWFQRRRESVKPVVLNGRESLGWN